MNLTQARHVLTRIFLQTKILELLDRHLYILLLIPLFLIAIDLSKPGITIAGDFPYLDTPDYASNRLWLWVDKGSIDGFEFLTRFPMLGLMYLLSFVHVNSELASKAMILLGFSLSSFSFYFSFLLFSKDRFNYPKTVLRISAIIGSLFYAYNVWNFNRIHHWYLWIGYSLLPLFFISSFLYLKNPRDWKYLVLAVFVWSIASSTPHMTLFYGVILVSMAIGFIIYRSYRRRTRLALQSGISFLLIFSCYLTVNIYWIYPYYLASGTQVLTPNYELTEDVIQLLSREGNFLNTFRILAYWLNTDIIIQEHSLLFYLWLYASAAIPVIAFSALLLKKSIKYALIFSTLGLIGIIFAMGTYSPFDYYGIVLSSPALARFVWVLRDSDKLSFLVTLAYSFLIGMVSCAIFSIVSRPRIKERKRLLLNSITLGIFTTLVIGSIFLVSYPFYETRTGALKPVMLPAEFDKLNRYLSTIDTDKVYFMPYPLYETGWNNKSRVGDIYQTHSAKPSIESTEYNFVAQNYYNYLENSIVENRSKDIGNLIHPLGTSYVIFHNDTWNKLRNSYDKNSIELLKKLYFIEDMRNTENIGLFKIFKITNDDKNSRAGQVFIPKSNIAVPSDLSALSSLSALTSFDSLNSSILFLDDIRTKQGNASAKSINNLILNRPSTNDEIALFFVDEKYVITPFDATYRYSPSEVWSKARARDPIHAEFHPYLKNFGIENWDLDYGKGMVMTSAAGAKISIPVPISTWNDIGDSGKDGHFNLFMRYLKSQKGGQIKIYLDDKLVGKVDTVDKKSSSFVWENVNSSINLTKGKHTLTLENVIGLNAVNIFTLVPPEELNRIRSETAQLLADNRGVIYLLEAESNFSNKKGTDSGLSYMLFGNDSATTGSDIRNQPLTGTFKGQFKVPENSDLAILQFSGTKNPNTEGKYSVRDIHVVPAYKKHTLFSSDFETNKISVPLAILRHSDWINYDKDVFSTALEVNRPLYGNSSLFVDMKPSDKSGWNVLSTDLIPIDSDVYYNATLDLSAKNVKQLHSRILYYNSEGKEITADTVYIFKGKDGTFRDTFTAGILPPVDARYLKLQVLTLSSNPNPSSYILDNVKLDELLDPYIPANKHSYNLLDQNNIGENNFDAQTENNSTHYVIRTNPIFLKENRVYNYTITTDSRNVTSLDGIALFKSSKDVVQNFTRYGNLVGSRGVLSLNDGSQIGTTLNILKSANYTIAMRAMSCSACILRVELVGVDKVSDGNGNNDVIQIRNVTLDNKSAGFSWKYANGTYLREGKYDLNIYSNSKVELDAVAIYADGKKGVQKSLDDKDNVKLQLFNSDKNSRPAFISTYERINPTKHIIHIKNATVPYVVAFAESYDPLWTAYAENNMQNNSVSIPNNNNLKVNSIPLYGVINGFPINKTGDYRLVIEYEPQKWFIQGAIISTYAIVIITIGIFIFVRRKTLARLLKSIALRK